jgi:hypothetical protein
MRRAPRRYDRYDQVQFRSTITRFLKPIRYQMWMKSHAIHAMKPCILMPRASAMARERPMVAIDPLSKYENGERGGCPMLSSSHRTSCAT